MMKGGDRVSGKSMLLLGPWRMPTCRTGLCSTFLKVGIRPHQRKVYAPDDRAANALAAQELTTACTDYARIQGSEPALWMQQAYALKMIQNLRKA